MEKTRVPKGENYWYINIFGQIAKSTDYALSSEVALFEYGNYFHTREEAEVMVRRLQAVLKGADVIEIPSEKEIEDASIKYNNGSLPNDFDYRNGFKDGVFDL